MGAIRRVVVALLVTALFAVAVVAGLAVLYAYQKKPLPNKVLVLTGGTNVTVCLK